MINFNKKLSFIFCKKNCLNKIVNFLRKNNQLVSILNFLYLNFNNKKLLVILNHTYILILQNYTFSKYKILQEFITK